MNIRNVVEAIETEVTQAYRDNNPSASLQELEFQLNILHRKVARLASKARMSHDNDSPDTETSCAECGAMMAYVHLVDVASVCSECLAFEAEVPF